MNEKIGTLNIIKNSVKDFFKSHKVLYYFSQEDLDNNYEKCKQQVDALSKYVYMFPKDYKTYQHYLCMFKDITDDQYELAKVIGEYCNNYPNDEYWYNQYLNIVSRFQ